jgi:hypothetical protein
MLCHAMPRAVHERRRQELICEAEHVRGPLYIERFCTWQSWLGRDEGTKESKPDTHSTPSTRAQKLNPGSVSGRNPAVRVGQPPGRKEGPSREPPRSGKDVDGTWVGIRLQAGKPGCVDRIVDPANFQGPGVKGRRPAFGGSIIPARHQKAGGRGLVNEDERENDCECAIDSRSQRLPASSVMVLL